MNPVRSYLTLQDLRSKLHGLRWSSDDNSLEDAGGVLAFSEEVAEFLEGFACVRRLVHFSFMLRLLMILRQPLDDSDAEFLPRLRLSKLFADTRRSLRNAGAFCGHLCHNVPAAREANKVAEICRRLRAREPLSAFMGEQADGADAFVHIVAFGYDPPEYPPFELSAFDWLITDALKTYRDDEVVHWFTHGRAPIETSAARTLAQAVPPTLAGRLASLLTRERLTRARAWVTKLLGALALPPRRLVNPDLPQSGYSDVTTRGQFDQILLSQFALDEWDFFRRFAERELLYFRREDPCDQTEQELVVILDQGVRTWGDVRLVLGAALLALAKQSVLRGSAFLLATSSQDLIDPLRVDEESLGEMIEASDLSANPGLALERVLDQASEKDRDIVLLTHPRNLDEPDVQAAAKRLRRDTRLFALTLDRHGQAELSELKHGTPVAIRQFRVDFTLASADAAQIPASRTSHWTGDVEPIGFPFRFGMGGNLGAGSFDFDVDGTHLLTAGPQGVLYLWDTTGKLVEILPRAMWQGNVVDWSAPYVLGVANGFVVAGVFDRRNLAVHIDLEYRKCACILIGDSTTGFRNWEYSPSHHCLIMPHSGGGLTIDLSTGERFATTLGGPQNRASDAWLAWERRQVPSRHLPVAYGAQQSRREPSVTVDADTGTVRLEANPRRMDPQSGRAHTIWGAAFTPQADGQPMLRRQLALAAQLGDMTLALQTSTRGEIRLHLIRGPEGVALGEYQVSHKKPAFRLSANGALLARHVRDAGIEITQVASNSVLGRTDVGGFVQQLPFILGTDRLLLLSGRHAFHLDWSRGKLEATYHSRADAPEVKQGIGATLEAVPEPCRYDQNRWLLGASNTLLAASDRYGQLVLFDRRHRLIGMFITFRTRLAGWMPDGTCFSHASTADEATVARFGRALQSASNMGKTA